MVQLNVPSDTTGTGPIAVFELLPVVDITLEQGATNIFKIDIGGSTTLAIDGSACQADLLIQTFLQNSPIGQPFLRILRAGQKELYKWGSPIDFITLSNLSGSFPIPLGLDQVLTPYRLSATTAGYVLIAGVDTDLDIEALTPPEFQAPLAAGTLPAGAATRVRVPIDTSLTCLLVYLDLSVGGVTGFTASGNQSGMFFRGASGSLPGPAPLDGINLVPLISSFDTSVGLVITTTALAPVKYWIVGRRDSFNAAIDQYDNNLIQVAINGGNTGGGINNVNPLPVGSQSVITTIDNAATTSGNGNTWNVQGYDGALMLECNNTNTGGTTTVEPMGSFDGANWYDLGCYQVVLNGATNNTLTRAAGALTLATAKRTVFQVLDPYPFLMVKRTSMGTGGSLTVKGYGVAV